MVSKRVIFGALLFLVSSNFLYFEGVFDKTIIPVALVGYEIGYSQLGPTGLVGYLPSHHAYPTRAHGIIVKYILMRPLLRKKDFLNQVFRSMVFGVESTFLW